MGTLPIYSVAASVGSALLAGTDPANHKAAMRDNGAGWSAAERKEIANHLENMRR
jgi:hypothetical protein